MKRLEAAGFLQRQRNPADEREVIVTLPSKGKSVHQRSKCLIETLLDRSGLSVADIIRLNAEISTLRDTLVRNSQGLA